MARLIADVRRLYFGCTRAIGPKSSPSSAIAKKMRGEASMLPISEPNVEIITITATNDTPARPNSAPIVSAAISRDFAMHADRVDVEIGGVGRAGRSR